MQHDMHQVSVRRPEGAGGGVSSFAAEVVARLVARDAATEGGFNETLVMQFMAAVAARDATAFEALKPELKRARVSPSMLADVYIPEVARRLGEAWEADCVSFADVTMGVARLQAILREIGNTWAADATGPSDGPTLLIILPQGEQHTLGAMVMAGRLRRGGISVCLRIAPNSADIGHLAAQRRFDGALISIACQDKLELCRKLVKSLKEATGGQLRVAVGGAILGLGEDVLKSTGADAATNDIDLALRQIGVFRAGAPVVEPI